MSDLAANITIPVDLTNPGQFFACCGLLELADRLWPGARGWFERRQFCLVTPHRSTTLAELLSETQAMWFDVGNDSEDKTDADDEKDDNRPNHVDPFNDLRRVYYQSLKLGMNGKPTKLTYA